MAIGDTGKEQRLIRTVFRRGYQFAGTVAQTAVEPRRGRPDGLTPASRPAGGVVGLCRGLGAERTVLADAWKDVIASGGGGSPVSGGGIGKTTLCSVFAAETHRGPWCYTGAATSPRSRTSPGGKC